RVRERKVFSLKYVDNHDCSTLAQILNMLPLVGGCDNPISRQATILVVDDDEFNLKLLKKMLSVEGHAVRTAASGEDALASVAEQLPDLVLLDVMMPGIDGFEVARQLKADARSRSIPIIMVTALEDRESRLKGLEAGAEDVLAKPVNRVELQMRVKSLLKVR
ncbi:MAG: response regulator, partial [Gallionella sp.]|nr:response regulator [Gallionella sp.]